MTQLSSTCQIVKLVQLHLVSVAPWTVGEGGTNGTSIMQFNGMFF